MNIIKTARRIVIKVGSSTLTHDTGLLNLRRIEQLARVISDFTNMGKEVILVTSGAVAAGVSRLRLDHRPATIEEKQATAAVGQNELMSVYERFFTGYGHTVGQILLTRETFEVPVARENARNTFNTLLRMRCIPIVNENDSVSFEEIAVGDNDTLSAYVAAMVEADALILLSDIDGLYDSDPHRNPDAKLIPVVPVIDEKILSYAGGAGSERGTGGVVTKLHAAQIATDAGIPMFLLNGSDPGILYDLFEGLHVGTYFMSK
ncbi:MAG: glutamate 5-kinase [Clostridiales bacterium]|nr:glutamate 5-kinase [Clostridiales bacterium]